MARLIDPLLHKQESERLNKAERKLREERAAAGELSASQIVDASPRPSAPPMRALPGTTLDQRIRADFRVFLTLIWRHVLGNDPNPIQLDLAYWLQHGPDRAIIMAFRGFSKSWITGAYALWRLYCDPDEKIMVVSGSMKRAIATSTWCFNLIMTMDILAHMRPKANTRQSATAWDVGNCIPAQSASFTPFGIGGQLVGFRGTCIIPDDVETQTNSLTPVLREKLRDGVKEFESVLVPGGVIKYLGTPHDVESLYMYLLGLKDNTGAKVYEARIWPALYPTAEQINKYRGLLAPFILKQIEKLGPTCVGHSTMPMRFPDSDLEKRRAAMGTSEFLLQFMLDLAGSLIDKYPLKLKDLLVMALDANKAPEDVIWGGDILRDLPAAGLDGDFFHRPAHVGSVYSPYSRKIGYLDGSGRGTDETSLSIGGELYGRCFLLDLFASKDGYGEDTLKAIARRCIKWQVSTLYLEDNFGDGMMTALLRPVVNAEWEAEHKRRKDAGLPALELQGTKLEEVKSSNMRKELRILSILEPVIQAHRLVVNTQVVLGDYESIQQMDGEEGRTRYSLFYQLTHMTREKDALVHEDRLESLSGLLSLFAAELGVDPQTVSGQAKRDREDALLRELEEDAWDAVGRPSGRHADTARVNAARPQAR